MIENYQQIPSVVGERSRTNDQQRPQKNPVRVDGVWKRDDPSAERRLHERENGASKPHSLRYRYEGRRRFVS